MSPPCHGVGFPVVAGRTHRHRPGAETSSSPPSPRRQRTKFSARPRWCEPAPGFRGTSWALPPWGCSGGEQDGITGQRGGTREDREGLVWHPLGWSIPRGSSITRTFPGVRGRSHPHTHPCGDGVALKMRTQSPAPRSCPSMPRHGGLSRPVIQQLCGPRARLDSHRVRVVTQPPADIIPINSGLCKN